jgi:asparagine synthase (glutamine-hydrolysing)
MCGICGLVRASPAAPPPDPDELARISAALAPRGPDGEGSWRSADGRARFGHRRLAILDLSPRGAQPMSTPDGRFTIVYNGEIYNAAELRAELAGAGVALRSTSDTEAILELVRRDGVASLARLRGMFAFALWDAATGELLLARDPYGIKPLYYAFDGETLRFASQVKALAAGGGVARALDPTGVAGFLAWGAVPEPFTLARAIRALPAGHLLRLGPDGALRIAPLPPAAEPPETRGAGAALAESVAAHLRADVPVALFLSAGLDSALVAALAARTGSERPTALTLTWAEARGTPADEEPLARATAAALGLPHRVREVDGAELRAALDRILAAMDQPSIDGFNTWLVARVAREEGLKVVLSGLGGDELCGGYRSFRDLPRLRRWARRLAAVPGAPALWPRLAHALAPRLPKLPALLELGGSFAGAYVLRRALFLPDEIDALLAALGLAERARRAYDPAHDAWTRLAEATLGEPTRLLADGWQAVHRLESALYLKNQLLRDADWAGMAHGVEIRVPLADAHLRAAFERLGFEPARSLGKAALVGSVAPELPRALFRRPKSGFQLPVEQWLSAGASGSRRSALSLGGRSRRLALRVLEAFGVGEAARLGASLRPALR